MKKFYLLVSVLCISFVVSAQEFKKFRWGLGLGYAMPGGNGAKGGILFYSEPSYRINDKISAGLRMEFAAMAHGYSNSVGDVTLNVSTSGSYSVNGQFYLTTKGFRPFVGFGLGLYSIKAISAVVDGQTRTAGSDESKIGLFPRVGFDAGHFSMLFDYNLIGATKIAGDPGKFINSYLGIRLGVNIGGGRK